MCDALVGIDPLRKFGSEFSMTCVDPVAERLPQLDRQPTHHFARNFCTGNAPLRDIEVLSCVSGGSIIGACYWLKLRERLLNSGPMKREDYIQLVKELIDHFQKGVHTNLRGATPSKAHVVWRFLKGEHGVLDAEKTAVALDENFFRPLLPNDGPIHMDELKFTPKDHNPALVGGTEFNPSKHNWLRADKVVQCLNLEITRSGVMRQREILLIGAHYDTVAGSPGANDNTTKRRANYTWLTAGGTGCGSRHESAFPLAADGARSDN